MKKRIMFSILAACIISMLLSFIVVTVVAQGYAVTRLSDELMQEAVLVAAGVEQGGSTYLDSLATEHRVTWIAKNGEVKYDNKVSAEALPNHSDREEFIEAVASGSARTIRSSETSNLNSIYCAVLLSDGSVLRVSGAQYVLRDMVKTTIITMCIALLVLIAAAVFMALYMAGNITQPLREIDRAGTDVVKRYRELSPLVDKYRGQNLFITRQMNELRRRQDEFAVITENMSEGIVVVDKQMELLSFNAGAMRVLGGAAAYGSRIDTLEHSDVLTELAKNALTGVHNEQGLETDGAFFRIIANPVWHDDEVTGAVMIILDVTEKANRDELRREFTSNVSHELKTPLTSIRAASELMMDGLVQPEDIQSFSKTIYDETGRMIVLVNDILRLSELDDSTQMPEKVEVDLYEQAQSVVERLSANAARSGILLKLEGEHAIVSGVPTLIEEIIYNLCDNAMKYNTEQGSVTVTVRDGIAPSISVADTGIGIASEHIGRIFERFYRVDKSRSRAIGGTGLGLSIVKHGAAYHNASISVESKVGEGTVITITFRPQQIEVDSPVEADQPENTAEVL